MFDPDIAIGSILTEKDIHRIFGCQTTFGIRLNKANHAIVIVSDATPQNRYPDIWKDDVLYYTGTDAGSIDGDQTLEGKGNNNGRLRDVWFESGNTRTTLFLFIKYATNQCTYKGIVELADSPFQEARKTDPQHTVWKFPLRLLPVDTASVCHSFEEQEDRAREKGISKLRELVFSEKAAQGGACKNQKRTVTTSYYERSPLLSAYVKERCEGVCDLCGEKAPFLTKDGRPYLESHHVVWLSRGGKDTVYNLVALCPNCHKKMHILDLEKDRQQLLDKIEEYIRRGS